MRTIFFAGVVMLLLVAAAPCRACGSGPHPVGKGVYVPSTSPREENAELLVLGLSLASTGGLLWVCKVTQRG